LAPSPFLATAVTAVEALKGSAAARAWYPGILAGETVAALASANPAAFLGLDHERGSLAPGLRADWVQLDRGFRPCGTWIGGRRAA
ncbi:amidohydrolase family protein, partial [Escherichia coli]|nr:amidohydrolase family protein [Escherichia coli]